MNNNNQHKLDRFIDNAILLKEHFNFLSFLYGSLFLSCLIKQDINVDDIDILISEIYIK